MTQSKELSAFYQAYLAWVEADAPADRTFDRCFGLCSNLEYFCDDNGLDEPYHELLAQFVAAGLSTSYPFGGRGEYHERNADGTQHLCPARMKWVRDHAAV